MQSSVIVKSRSTSDERATLCSLVGGRRGYAVIDPRNCYIGGQSTSCRINALIRDVLGRDDSLSLWFHHTGDPNDVERQIICDVRPLWNIVG